MFSFVMFGSNICRTYIFFFFFFNDTATTEIYTLSLHDALPICLPTSGTGGATLWGCSGASVLGCSDGLSPQPDMAAQAATTADRKSTRLNSRHLVISYAVFCLKKKKTNNHTSANVQVSKHIPLP